MAETIGDVFGRGYRSGRAIGDDFSQWRYARGEAKIRNRLDDEAKAAGMTTAEYLSQVPDGAKQARMADLESELQQLYVSSGSARRGVTGADGAALNEGSVGRFQQDYTRGINRLAAQDNLAGNVEGGQRRIASGAAAMGDYEGSRNASLAADQIQNSTAALRPDGTYDAAKGRAGMSAIAARQGNDEGAYQGSEQARMIRMQMASQLGGQLMPMLQNPEAFGEDKIIATANALLENVPEMGSGLAVQAGSDGNLWIGRNGTAYVQLTQDGAASPEALSFLDTLTQDPRTVIGQQVEQLRNSQQAGLKRQQDVEDKFIDASLEIAKELGKYDPKVGAAAELLSGAMGNAAKAGWKFFTVDDTTTTMTDTSGRVFFIKTNPEAGVDPATGVRQPQIQITDQNGRPVSNDELQGDAVLGQFGAATVALQTAVAQGNVAAKAEFAKMAFGTIGRLAESMGVQTNVGGALGGQREPATREAGAVQADYEELGKKHGFDTTSTTRSPDENRKVGGVANSQHLDGRGTARDWSVKGKTQEQINAFVADLRAAGYEVITKNHGTGPHIHAELPPGGGAQPARKRAVAVATNAPAAKAPAIKGGALKSPVRAPNRTNFKAEAAVLAERREELEQAIASFETNERKTTQLQQFGRDYVPRAGYTQAQQQRLSALQNELEQVKRGEVALQSAQRRGRRAAIDTAEEQRLAKYAATPTDAQRRSTLEKWAR